jgi:hypothetical protein
MTNEADSQPGAFRADIARLREAWRHAGYGIEGRLRAGVPTATLDALEDTTGPLCWDLRELWQVFGGTAEGGLIRERYFFPLGMLLSPKEAVQHSQYVCWDEGERGFLPFMEDGAGGYWVQTFVDGRVWYASGEEDPVLSFRSITEMVRVLVAAFAQGVVARGASGNGLAVDHQALHELREKLP